MPAFNPIHKLMAISQNLLLGISTLTSWGFPGGSVVKNLPATQETQVQSLGQEDPLEKGMATHSSILAWRLPWTEEPGGLQTMGVVKSQTLTQLP